MADEFESRALTGRPNQWTGEGPVWCPVATMSALRSVDSATDELRRGTKHFAPGAKLYLRHIMGWRNSRDDEPDIEVVGRHRGTHRYVRMSMRAAWAENWRIDLVYSPTVIRLLWPKWDETTGSKAVAEEYVNILASVSKATPE
ncbi:MAG TPA: hypothetical protein VF792_06520 [Ktedonobacterales bacterium]